MVIQNFQLYEDPFPIKILRLTTLLTNSVLL
jgi:hypothetical protein